MSDILLFITAAASVAAVISVTFIGWKMTTQSKETADPRMKAELENMTKEVGQLEEALDKERSERNVLQGKNKQLFAEHTKLEAKHESVLMENDALKKKVTEHDAEARRREREQETKLTELTNAKHSFEEERARVIREDEVRRSLEEKEHDRMWAEHEQSVISLLTDLCKKPEHSFTSYSNTDLPEGFNGSLKPDFLMEFLDQYIVFDAKVSKATNLQVYIADQVKKTAVKIKGKEKIYPTIFLVVPTHAIGELSKTFYYEDGLRFFVVSPEALAPILSIFKRMEKYETMEGWDPQEREAIVDLITQFDYHISLRNAVDYQLMQHGLEMLGKTQGTDPALAKEVAVRKAKMRALNFKTSEQKEFLSNPQLLQDRLLELTEPKARIQKKDIGLPNV